MTRHRVKSPFCRRVLLVALGGLAFPVTAQAHTPIEGIGDFLAGLVHPVTTPSHILLLLGLGMLLGQHPPLKLKVPMLVFVSGSALALLLTFTGWVSNVYPAILLCLALGAAVLVALEKSIPPAGRYALLAASAVALGLDSGVESSSTVSVLKTLAGTWTSLTVLLADIAIYASFGTKKPWLKVGIRVIGSWIIAVLLLMLAVSLRW